VTKNAEDRVVWQRIDLQNRVWSVVQRQVATTASDQLDVQTLLPVWRQAARGVQREVFTQVLEALR